MKKKLFTKSKTEDRAIRLVGIFYFAYFYTRAVVSKIVKKLNPSLKIIKYDNN